MKRDFPWMLAVGVVWVAFGILAWLRGDSSQAGINFSVGVVFATLGAASQRSGKAQN